MTYKATCWQGLEVRRPIQVGESIPDAAFTRNDLIHYGSRMTAGALELHMLHPVGKPLFPHRFEARANPHPHPMADDRCRMHLLQPDLQAVRQCLGNIGMVVRITVHGIAITIA